MKKLGILGIGKMGSCILKGITASGIYAKEDILLYTPNKEHTQAYSALGYSFAAGERELFSACEILLLAIKPQLFPTVLSKAQDMNFQDRCVISVAAGKSISSIEKYFKNATVIRAMPNTPALIQKATTTFCYNREGAFVIEAKKIFSSIGEIEEIKEYEMNATVPLNGSMPAYLYLFAKGFIEAGVSRGIEESVCRRLCCNAIKGSADMLLSTKEDIEVLIENVCSKGGTTVAGLERLYEKDFQQAISECYEACAKRAEELNE